MIATGPLRWQPPVHSPLDGAAVMRAFTALCAGSDPRPALASRLQRMYDAERVVLTGSGTDALRLALTSAVRVAPGGAAVAIPAYSCFDVATAAVGSGAPIALYDIEPATLAPSIPSLCRCLAEGARIVVVSPLYGVPVDWRAITRAARPWGALVIEDAAQGHGATWEGRPLGSLAPMSVLSFGRGKGWTGGSGGAVLLRDHSLLPESHLDPLAGRGLRDELVGLAKATSQWLLARPTLYRLPATLPGLHLGATHYRPPSDVRPMSRGAAALLEWTVGAAAREAEHRRAAVEWLELRLPTATDIIRIDLPQGGSAGWLRYPIVLSSGMAGLADGAAARALGIMPGYPRTLGELPAVQERLVDWCRTEAWPGAATLSARLVTLPTHSLLSVADRERLVRILTGHTTAATGRMRRYKAA